MTPDVVVDVGNTRVKWGRCGPQGVGEIVSLPSADTDAWRAQRERWYTGRPLRWAVSGVVPKVRQALGDWLRAEGDTVAAVESARQLPLTVALEFPDRVGIDRLLNAVAVNRGRARDSAAVIVDAGSAVTVDYVDASGVFRGGAIFPGLRLMAKALHDYTALLPPVEVRAAAFPPGSSTTSAIQVGVFHAVLGGVEALTTALERAAPRPVELYLAGGDAPLLAPHLSCPAVLWPQMTLEGLRAAALEMPP